MLNSVKSWPASVSSVMPTPRFHQNHSVRDSDSGRRHASAGMTTNSTTSAAVMRRTVSIASRVYMVSVGRVVRVIELVERAACGARGEDAHDDSASEQTRRGGPIRDGPAADESDRDIGH